MIIRLSTCLLALGAIFGAHAQSVPLTPAEIELRTENARVIEQVTLADLEALVMSIDHAVDARQMNGPVSVRGLTPQGVKYLLVGTACEPLPSETGDSEAAETQVYGCFGINMQVRYRLDPSVTLEKINLANLTHAAVGVWRTDDMLGVHRFVILDGGQTMANVRENLTALLSTAPYIVDIIWPSETVQPESAEPDQAVDGEPTEPQTDDEGATP